jgi:hypothetical protein
VNHTATYSPEDNKLRMYPACRLDSETYARVRAAGFKWAPKQELFVTPMWTPSREDLLIELCGEIGDEDTSLVERAEQRADRFEDYSDARKKEADENANRAHNLLGAMNGQPILVGHHSEKRHRRDISRVDSWMHNACTMWNQSKYWKERAAGAVRLAKYKERPDVRARRIKGLEADKRKEERNLEQQKSRIALWSKPMTDEQARYLAGHSNTVDMQTYFKLDKGEITGEQAAQTVIEQATKYSAYCARWIEHLSNRLEYERAMLAESGGTETDRVRPEVGGACQAWCSWRGGYSLIQKVNKVSVTLLDNWGNGGEDFPRTVPSDKLKNLMSKAEVDKAREEGRVLNESKRGFHLEVRKGKTNETPALEGRQSAAPSETTA